MQRIVKHQHGTPNPIILQEEESMIAMVNRALASSSNAQTIGRNGEVPLRDFLNRYLPYTLRAATGHFVPPSGILSPQIDILILDARYPLLSQNADGSVLVMLHSVVAVIEVKTRMTSKDIGKMWEDAIKINLLVNEVKGYADKNWGSIMTYGFAYGCANRLDTLEDRYTEEGKPDQASLDISLLRLHPKDAIKYNPLGAEFHFEPLMSNNSSSDIIGYEPLCIAQLTPLSDFYYNLIQTSYYTIGSRDYGFNEIGRHFMEYMSWSTVRWQGTMK